MNQTRPLSEFSRRLQAQGRIDGSLELASVLDHISRDFPAADRAPRTSALAAHLKAGLMAEPQSAAETLALVRELLERSSIWWSPASFSMMPILVPWAIRDRSARYDQGPESWSAPRADGYLRDDNSIIKKLPLTLTIRAHRN